LTAFLQAWHVETRFDRLLKDQAITPFEWRIGCELRTLLERAYQAALRAHDPARLKVDGGRLGPGDPSAGQLAAATRLRQLRAQLGDHDLRLLEIVVVNDISWCALGRRLKVHAKTARAWALAAIHRLSQAW
jgi:hypothetical protein